MTPQKELRLKQATEKILEDTLNAHPDFESEDDYVEFRKIAILAAGLACEIVVAYDSINQNQNTPQET